MFWLMFCVIVEGLFDFYSRFTFSFSENRIDLLNENQLLDIRIAYKTKYNYRIGQPFSHENCILMFIWLDYL